MSKNYVITTAQRGGLPNWEMLKSLETYCEHNCAELLILPTNGRNPSSTKEDQKEVLHRYFRESFNVIEEDFKINDNLDIKNFPVKAQQMIPLTSWGRYVQYDKSAIMASPKLFQKCEANSNRDLPRVLMSTGAVTHPHYKTNSWGVKALLDHRYAAIVVNVQDDEIFHYRQLTSTKNGVIYDLGWKYHGSNKPVKEPVEALVLGDVHVGFTDPKVIEATYRMIDELQPKVIFYHDICDCYSVNHHHVNDVILQAQKARNGLDSLEEEAFKVGQYLHKQVEMSPKTTKHKVVKANHDEAIDKYLREGRFAKDPKNLEFACKLIVNSINESRDTLEFAIEQAHGPLPPNVGFLPIDKDYKIKGWQFANHGHRGPSGTRGSPRNLEGAVGRGMFGHFHSPEIFRDVWVVGTSTYLQLEYNKGFPSNWLQCHGVLSPNGKPQLINIIEGNYKPGATDPSKKSDRLKKAA